MKHSYLDTCGCDRCTREKARRGAQALSMSGRPWHVAPPKGQRRPTRRSTVASREEQAARYLDCGPAAWDDR
jgi:hypothetical protein